LKDLRTRHFGERSRGLEKSVRTEAARMDNSLGNPLVVKVKDLLAEMEILHQHRPARTHAQVILIVGDGDALLRRQRLITVLRRLVRRACVVE